MKKSCLVAAIVVASAASASADRITVGPVTLEPPAGFRQDGSRLVADGAVWAFVDPVATADLDAWLAAAWKALLANYRDVQIVPATRQKLPSGWVIAIQGAAAGDAQNHDHYLMFVAAYRPDAGRVYPSLFDASSHERYAALSPVVGKALVSIAVASGQPAPAKPADKPASNDKPADKPMKTTLPDGRYGCQTIGYGIGNAQTASVLGTVRLAGSTYTPESYKGSGKVTYAGNELRFSGGPFDGFIAAIGAATSTVYFRFAKDPKARPAPSTTSGDVLCYLQNQH